MSSLEVTTDEVKQLASDQDDASSALSSATNAVFGLAASVEITHGIVCSATALATHTAMSARESAGNGLKSISSDLSDKLNQAAGQYDSTDQQGSAEISFAEAGISSKGDSSGAGGGVASGFRQIAEGVSQVAEGVGDIFSSVNPGDLMT